MVLSTPTTTEMLGFSRDARLLIINADDFGMCHTINDATIQAITGGLVGSCTLMAPCPWALHGRNWLKEHPDLPFGVHLTAISEQPNYRWGPLASKKEVSSLIDEDSYFYPLSRVEEMLDKVRLIELELEFRTQIEWVLNAGLQPTHLDSHCHVHARRERIFDMTFGLAREYGLAMRVGHPQFMEKLQSQGYPTDDYLTLDSYALPTEDKVAIYCQMLRDLPVGLSEWAVHPGTATAELQAIGPSWDVREADFTFLMSSEAREIMQAEGIISIDYRRLQEMWRAHR
jgi:chitin disaccharide deacetylase